ncbi:hypothetical protein KXY27_004560, partial [Salmonella enterica]|nr:hypothetical protein [Salmonella enterica]EHU5767758.1 hypothetical protein [Salmonella enterica]
MSKNLDRLEYLEQSLQGYFENKFKESAIAAGEASKVPDWDLPKEER